MQYEDLHRRYGTHVSQRLRRELSASEFKQAEIGALPEWLATRAETAHTEYRRLQNNPLASSHANTTRTAEACRQWREAEDLAYLVAIAEDVTLNARAG